MEPIAAKCDHQEKKFQVEPLQSLPGIPLHDLSVVRACASKRQIPSNMKDLLLITLRDHLDNLQKRKVAITQNYDLISKHEDDIGFRRQRDAKEISRLHLISEALTTDEYHATLSDNRKRIRITRQSIHAGSLKGSAPKLLSSSPTPYQRIPNKQNKILDIPLSDGRFIPSVDVMSMPSKKIRSQAHTSELFYPSYLELSPTDFSVLAEYWSDVDCCYSPLDPEVVRLFLGLADFPPLTFDIGCDKNSSVIDNLISCLIPENEEEVNKNLQEVQDYYTKNGDRIKKKLDSNGVFEEDPWTFRTLLRYKDHLNVYVRDELESLGLWEEEESVEDDALDSMSANVQQLLQLRSELQTTFSKYKDRLLEEVEKINRYCVCYQT